MRFLFPKSLFFQKKCPNACICAKFVVPLHDFDEKHMIYQLIISIPLMVCLFWATFFTIRAVQGTTEPRVNTMVMLFYIATTVLYLDHWMYFSGVLSFAGEWSYGIVNLCVYPLFYMYLRVLARAKEGREAPWLLVPAGLFAVLFPVLYIFEWSAGKEVLGVFARICFAAQVIWVWVRGSRLLRNARERMDETYSDYRSELLRPVNTLLQLFGFTAVASLVLVVIGREFFIHETEVTIPAIIMSVLLYGLGYVASNTTIPPEVKGERGSEVSGSEVSGLEEKGDDELMRKIDHVMREEQLYRNASLTIHDLAAAVNSNRTYVSNCINRTNGQSFSQYVATYRISCAKEILSSDRYASDHDAIADAVAQSGFLSYQTFYRVFKDSTDSTPLQYRQKILKKS